MKTQTQRAGARSDPYVLQAVVDLADENPTASHDWLESELERRAAEEDSPLKKRKLIGAKTIGRVLAERTAELSRRQEGTDLAITADDVWTLDSLSGDARPVLRVLRAAIEHTKGRVRAISKAEAAMATAIAASAPELAPVMVWRLARMYAGRTVRGWASDDLDALLAYAPWQSEVAWEDYYRACADGLIVEVASSILSDLGSARHWSLFGRLAWRLEPDDAGHRFKYAQANRQRVPTQTTIRGSLDALTMTDDVERSNPVSNAVSSSE